MNEKEQEKEPLIIIIFHLGEELGSKYGQTFVIRLSNNYECGFSRLAVTTLKLGTIEPELG